MESDYLPINQWMDKENVVFINDGIVFSHKEE
jgi:hypothetical protein